jgi:protein SCO1/2
LTLRRPALVLLATAWLVLDGHGPAAPHVVAPRPRDPALSATPSLPRIKPAPDFALPDTTGRLVRLSGLRGHVVLVSFIYTSCTDACPLVIQRMAVLGDRLERDGLGARVLLLSITVDPTRDSPEVLARYAARFRANPARWRFLRDEPGRLEAVLAAYDEWTRARPGGDIDHPARLYLIDSGGVVREIYSLTFFDQRQAFLDIRALLRESR